MKYYIECTVNKKDPLTGQSNEYDVDLSLSHLVDVEPDQMNDEWAKNRLISEYWEDFSPATPPPRRWYDSDRERDENNDYYTMVIYTATDDGEPDFDNIVAGASMDTCDIWEARKEGMKNMTDKEYKAIKAERKAIADKIAEQGAGAAVKWNQLSTSAMAGNAAAKAACAELLGRPVKSMLDLFNIQYASGDCMTRGEDEAMYTQGMRDLMAGHDVTDDAAPYLANRLAAYRKGAGLTQKELAARAGMPVVTLQKLENGVNSILRARTETTAALAKALGVTVEELIAP